MTITTGSRNTEYHDGEVRYHYLRLNCAKTIGAGFRYGAGYRDLEVTSATLLSGRRLVAAANANIPTEMAMKLLKEWNARGYRLDVVRDRKYEGSTYVDPHGDEKAAFKDLPNRFPSVLSSDFRKKQDHYEDIENLFAMYLLYNLSKYRVRVNNETKLLEIDKSKIPCPTRRLPSSPPRVPKKDSEDFRRRLPFRRRGTEIGDPADETNKRTVP